MGKARVFTKEELENLGKPRAELIKGRIDSDDKEGAKRLTRQMHREFLFMHNIYRDWLAGLLSFIARRYGDNAVYEAIKESFGALIHGLSDAYEGQDERRRAEMAAAGLRGHLHPFDVEEDEEKFTFFTKPCGSGGQLILEGKYGPPFNFHKIQEAQDMTFGKPDFPVYCTHCYLQNVLPIKFKGHPIFITVPSDRLGEEPCRLYLYKDPSYCPNLDDLD